MKNIIITILAFIIIGGGVYIYLEQKDDAGDSVISLNSTSTSSTSTGISSTSTVSASSESAMRVFTIGTTTSGAAISAYSYGTGTKEIILISGLHGNYSYNAINLLKELFIDGFKDKSLDLQNVKVTVIPNLKDGTYENSEKSSKETNLANRLKDNNVDLNRNFDCDWKAKGKFQTYDVSGGSAPFSEPESRAVRDYILNAKPSAVIAYFSASSGVYASSCGGKTNAESLKLTSLYAKSSGYKEYKSFDNYETSGDMTNWLSKIGVPAISVLLTNHEDIELDKNIKGLQAVIDYFK